MIVDPRELDFWSIDPGDVHVGLAEFRGGRCISATETRPHDIEDRLYASLVDPQQANSAARAVGGVAHPQLLVVERFALRGDLMAQQQGSEFLTSQLIGALRCLCRLFRVPVVIQTPHQASVVKKRQPWEGWPVRRWTSYGHGTHAKLAEQHGYFFVQERLREQDRAQMNLWMHQLGNDPVTT